ncbi:fatty acyl-CoA reductase wat-like isoform X2 [Vespula maculifrons]|uniref:Fatty acyl-CoA reductase wat-like isoform X2 n=1 Tax=Vespula maculifrons TaxID=7453 RepID=A0ABD2BPF5_VESMC
MTEVPIIEYEQEIAFENIKNLSTIQEFYYGFIGKFLIEKSLRTDPVTNCFYLLIRPKERKNSLTQ